MPMKEDWKLWHQEQADFEARGTKGFTADLSALEQHIKKLIEVCPKDEAGWPTTTALSLLDKLRQDYNRFKAFADQFSS